MKKILISSICFFLFSACTSMFYQPTRFLYANPSLQKITFENIYFDSKDKTKLHGWYLHNSQKLKKPKGLIIHFHGNAQNMSSHFLNLSWITKHGYDLFVFDYRGYGTSEGEAQKDGVFDDSLAALNKAHQLLMKYKSQKLIVYGQSLGGALAVSAINQFKDKKDISLLVLDSTFMNYKKIAFQLLKKFWLSWPISPLAYILISNKYQTENIIKTLRIPTLVIHGKKDRVINFSNGESIFNQLTVKNKTFWPLENGQHISIFSRKDDPYRSLFVTYLNKLNK